MVKHMSLRVTQSFKISLNTLLYAGMDKTETMIPKHLCWYVIIKSIQREVSNGDTCQHAKGKY